MKQHLLALAVSLMPLAAVGFEGGPVDDAVPIEQEPRHRLKFENEYVRYFDVGLEPGYETRMHWHRNDGVFVNIEASPTLAQDLGKDAFPRGERAIGETYFIGYGTKPKAHRITNTGATPYHVVDTEILKGCGASPAGEGPNQSLLIDNDRAYVTRIMLHPGESTELYAPCGVLVAVSSANISMQSAAGEKQIELPPAGYVWREQGDTVTLVNTGKFVFHGVDIRLK